VDVKWHAYIIDHQTDLRGEDYLDYNERRWGSDSWTNSLRKKGKEYGLEFKNWKWWPNTLHAHRLVRKAADANQAHDVLFRRMYEEGENISLKSVLVSAGQELNIPDVEKYINSDEGLEEVLLEDRNAKKKLRIQGVPHFIIAGRSVEGSQAPPRFLAILLAAARGTLS